jgi:hypothetical protein
MQCPRIAIMGVPGVWDPSVTPTSQGNAKFESWLSKHSKGCGTGFIDFENTTVTASTLAPYNAIIMFDLFHSKQDRIDCVRNLSVCKGNQSYQGSSGWTNYNTGRARQLTNAEVTAFHNWIKNGAGISTSASFFYNAPETNNVNKILAPFNVRYKTRWDGQVDYYFSNSGNGADVSGFVASPPINLVSQVTRLQVVSAVPIEIINMASPIMPVRYSNMWDGGTDVGLGYYVEVENNGKKGRINVWADEWITYDTVWNKVAAGGYAYQPERYWENVVNWIGRCRD